MRHHHNHFWYFALGDQIVDDDICPSEPGAPVGVIVARAMQKIEGWVALAACILVSSWGVDVRAALDTGRL